MKVWEAVEIVLGLADLGASMRRHPNYVGGPEAREKEAIAVSIVRDIVLNHYKGDATDGEAQDQ